MLARLIDFSLRHASLVVVAGGIVLLLAGLKVKEMPVDVLPELNAPTVVIMTEARGLAADEVEINVTISIKTSVNGLPGTRRVRSASAVSLSIVWVQFDRGTDIYRAANSSASGSWPCASRSRPVRTPRSPPSPASPARSCSWRSQPDASVSPLEMRSFAEFDLRNKVLAVPGVAQVVAIGGELQQFQINVRQDQLALYGQTISDVVAPARGAHSTSSAGYLQNWENQELPIRQVARASGIDSMRQTMVKLHNGTPVVIGLVADVQLGPAPKRGTAADRGMPAVVVSVQKSPRTNTLEITKQIDGVREQIEKAMPKGMVPKHDPFRAARFTDRSVSNAVKVLIEASVIVAIILILLLMNVRATIATLTALPLSLAVAVLLLWAFGLSIYVMTLGGLAVAIGELVDDAIIDVENILRRLKENAVAPEAQRNGFVEVIYNTSNEVRSSVVFATIIICMVFVPLLFLQGLEGRFFQPLGVAYILLIMASLIVAPTVTPAICKLLFAGSFGRKVSAGTPAVGHSVYAGHDGWLLHRPLLPAGHLHRQHGRLCNPLRHCRLQRHPARQPLQAPARDRWKVHRRLDHPRLNGTADADPDDRSHGPTRPCAPRARYQQAGQ